MYTEFLILATLDTLCSLSRNSHSVLLYISTSRHSLSHFSIRTLWLLYTHSPFFCTKFITRTHIHTYASILLVLDVRSEELAFIVYVIRFGTPAVEHQGESRTLSSELPIPHIYIYIYINKYLFNLYWI